eukprot:353516-Chlamydomonas_euryale.AAC.1
MLVCATSPSRGTCTGMADAHAHGHMRFIADDCNAPGAACSSSALVPGGAAAPETDGLPPPDSSTPAAVHAVRGRRCRVGRLSPSLETAGVRGPAPVTTECIRSYGFSSRDGRIRVRHAL